MNNISIEDLAYYMKEARDNKQPAPIFFLGAGASQTAGIPLAKKIISDVLKKYANNPQIKTLKKEFPNLEEMPYFRVMSCLGPDKRKALFKDYIDNAKINVTHIYLAQLFKEGYVDYVVTVNFDNLMQRALALYNIFPPVYDLSNIKDWTTTTLDKESIIHLHGQYRGQWLLNTSDELDKINENVSPLFHSIMSGRPWIFIGYSANDPIWKVVTGLGCFEHKLCWLNYKTSALNKNVHDFLNTPNTNSFIIKDSNVDGYDSDTFMLKLNTKLGISQPEIFDQPFNVLKTMLDSIVDIGDDEHYKGVKERLEYSKERVDEIIASEKKDKVLQLSRRIRAFIMQDKYPEQETDEAARNKLIQSINELESDAKSIPKEDVSAQMAWIYNEWGNCLDDLAKIKSGEDAEDLLNKAIINYKKAIDLNPQYVDAYYNCGIAVGDLATTKSGKAAEVLLKKAISKYEEVIKLNPRHAFAYNNWGNCLWNLASTKSGEDAETLLNEAISLYEKAIEQTPENGIFYNNWGCALNDLAKIKGGEEAKKLNFQAIEKYKQAIKLGGKCFNLSCIYAHLSNKKEALRYLEQSLQNKEYSIEHIKKDEDWKAYLEDADFIALLKKYESGHE